MCLLAICMFWRNVYLDLLPNFWWASFFFFNCMSCLYILEVKLSLAIWFAIFFFYQPAGCLFYLIMVSVAVQELISLIRSHLFIFAFISITLGDWRIHWHALCHLVFCLCFLWEFCGVMSYIYSLSHGIQF